MIDEEMKRERQEFLDEFGALIAVTPAEPGWWVVDAMGERYRVVYFNHREWGVLPVAMKRGYRSIAELDITMGDYEELVFEPYWRPE